ncbi:pectin [Sclerotinia borealis F-4128]|uniref:Pectin n=1 Tax=Sclerotinia borealis (strain F-4128) TaxID=1432307 RepID=W9CRX2_SCLBF|nr:pectin [Sclerotinia borealis F-4128]
MVAVTGIVTAGASALGLAAAIASMHLPTKTYRVERKRRLSQPADQEQGDMARLALQKTNSAGSITEKVTTKSGFQPGKKVLGKVKE